MSPKVTKRDQIVSELRRRILSHELERGARMRQDELAREFKASITPVREALRLLEAEGLLDSSPHRGARVAGVDRDHVKAIYVLRRLVEGYAMSRAVPRLSPLDHARLRHQVARMSDVSGPSAGGRFRADNREFHFYFYDRCGMPALVEQIGALWNAFPWDLLLDMESRSSASHDEHLAILAAVERGDARGAAAAVEAHISHGFRAISRSLSGDDVEVADPFDIFHD